MDEGIRLYKELINDLVNMSQSCAESGGVENAAVRGTDRDGEINELLAGASQEVRKALAGYVLGAYQSGIYDVLVHLEWLRECKGMKISVEGEELSAGQYEVFPCDFIGRCKGQEWPDK